MHRQRADDVGLVVALSVAVAEQPSGDGVPIGLVLDQDAAEVVAAIGVRMRRRARSSASSPVTLISTSRR